MAKIDSLPSPIAEVRIPRRFSVSDISKEVKCELKLVLSSTSDAPSLPVHPNAEIGRLFHKLIERAVKGRIERSGSPKNDAKREFENLLAETEERLRKKKKTQRYARLSETITALRWHQKINRAVKTAARWLEKGSDRGEYIGEGYKHYPARSSTGLTYRSLGDAGRWSEVSICDEELRLAGRMDLVEKKGNKAVIRDFKTGRVKNGEGEILPHIKRQLRLYGLMVKRATPRVDLELIVEGQQEYVVSFDREIIAQTEARVRRLVSSLAKGKTIAAADLAQPGAGCASCCHRHVCDAYLRNAPARWENETSYRLPSDIGGTVESITGHSEELIDLVLHDEAGRRVKIFDLAREHAQGIHENIRLWFFGLKTYPGRHAADSWRHPLNFFEVSLDKTSKRAWTLRIYETD